MIFKYVKGIDTLSETCPRLCSAMTHNSPKTIHFSKELQTSWGGRGCRQQNVSPVSPMKAFHSCLQASPSDPVPVAAPTRWREWAQLIYGPPPPTLQIKRKVSGGSGMFSLGGTAGAMLPGCGRRMKTLPEVAFLRNALFFDASIN